MYLGNGDIVESRYFLRARVGDRVLGHGSGSSLITIQNPSSSGHPSRPSVICPELPSPGLRLSRSSPWTVSCLKTPYPWLNLKGIYLNFCYCMPFGEQHRVWETTLTIQCGLSNLPLGFRFEADIWNQHCHSPWHRMYMECSSLPHTVPLHVLVSFLEDSLGSLSIPHHLCFKWDYSRHSIQIWWLYDSNPSLPPPTSQLFILLKVQIYRNTEVV